MSEFKVITYVNSECFISDGTNTYLHSDGSILNTVEYFPTHEQAHAVLDKFQPKHEWVHGDVMIEQDGSYPKMYIDLDHDDGGPRVIHLQGGSGNKGLIACGKISDYFRSNPVFLFNVNKIVEDWPDA